MNTQIFDLVRIKPFTKLLKLTSGQFTQKLHKHSIRGYIQSFDLEQKLKIKTALLSLAEIIKQEAEKIDCETPEIFERVSKPTRKLCREAA